MKTTLSNEQLQAFAKYLSTSVPKAGILVNGKLYSGTSLVKLAEGILEARSAATTSKGKWRESRAQTAVVEANNAPILSAVRLMLGPMLGNGSTALATLAVTPRKSKRRLTTEEQLVSAEKARATRLARGTQSKKQKAKVRGNVTGIVVTAVTTAASTPGAAAATLPANPPTASSPVPAASAPVASVAVPVVAAPSTPVVPAAPASVAVAADMPVVTGH